MNPSGEARAELVIPAPARVDEAAVEGAVAAMDAAMGGAQHTREVARTSAHEGAEKQELKLRVQATTAAYVLALTRDSAGWRLEAQAGSREEADARLGELAGALMTTQAQEAKKGAGTRKGWLDARSDDRPLEALLDEAEKEKGGYGVGLELHRAWARGLGQACAKTGVEDARTAALLERVSTVLAKKIRTGRYVWHCGPRHTGERRNEAKWLGWMARNDAARRTTLWEAIGSRERGSAVRTVLVLEAAQALVGTGGEAAEEARREVCDALDAVVDVGRSAARGEQMQMAASTRDLISAATAAGGNTAQALLGEIAQRMARPGAGATFGREEVEGLEIYARRGHARRAGAMRTEAWDEIVAKAARSTHPAQAVRMMLRSREEPKFDAEEAHALVEALERRHWEAAEAAVRAAFDTIPKRVQRSVHGTTPAQKGQLAARAREALDARWG